jgi:hypothetical protein
MGWASLRHDDDVYTIELVTRDEAADLTRKPSFGLLEYDPPETDLAGDERCLNTTTRGPPVPITFETAPSGNLSTDGRRMA